MTPTSSASSPGQNSSVRSAIFLAAPPALLALVIYWPVLRWLVKKWIDNPMYSHGFLVPFVSVWLLWGNRASLERAEKSTGRAGLSLVIFALIIQMISASADVKTVWTYSLILLIWAVLYFLWGSAVARITLLPIAFLIFMVPVVDAVINPLSLHLKLLVAKLAVWLLDASRILVVVREGVMIHMPSGSLEVADPCSGIRSLIALSAMAALFGYLHRGRLWERLAIVLAVAPIAIMANLTRVIMLCLITEKWGAAAVESETVHTLAGTLVYIVALVCLVSFGRLLPGDRPRPEPG